MKKDGAIKREEEEVVIKLHDLMSCEPAKYSMKNMMSHVFEVREMRHGRRTRERESERERMREREKKSERDKERERARARMKLKPLAEIPDILSFSCERVQ